MSSTDAVAVIAARLAATAPPTGVQTKFLAIDGLGGAGKTTLAVSLSAKLGGAPIAHTDDFASWEQPLDWWPRMLAEVLVPLAAGRQARYRRRDWERRRLGNWREIEPSECVIIEGVGSSRAVFRPYLTVAVWVEAPREERLRRGLERDGHGALPQWEQWMAREDEYAARESPQKHADVVVSGVR